MNRRRAFTLVELLVVIAIITILLAILLPVIQRARESAIRTLCVGNLRAIGQALILYSFDNKGDLPGCAHGPWNSRHNWIVWFTDQDPNESMIKRHLGGNFQKFLLCPSDDPRTHNRSKFGAKYPYSYTVNSFCSWRSSRYRLDKIHYRERLVLAVEEAPDTVDDGCFEPGKMPIQGPQTAYVVNGFDGTEINFVSNRHDISRPRRGERAGRGNIIFADGHCDFIDGLQTYRAHGNDPIWYPWWIR